ncbi:MAG TPA: hypothetical protein VLY23_02075 [Candidatus Acidoferrum sp.]|nr:hypothetical protein [Candidatus Acidoferrum sp.]
MRISFVLELDHANVTGKFQDPKNASWSLSEEGAQEILTFSDEILVPNDMRGGFSPHLATFVNYEDFDKYRHDEGLRQLFVTKLFSWSDRCLTHYERANWRLFDKESPSPTGEAQTPLSRLIALYNFFQAGFSKFTGNSRGNYDRILQRIEYGKARSPRLYSELAENFLSSGRILRLWNEIAAVRRSFVGNYNSIQPLYQMFYWRKEFRLLSAYKLSEKRFDSLKQLYIDCFETLCRLMVAAIGVEAIIHHGSLEIPTKKSTITLDEFEGLKNSNKRDHLRKYPIEDLFVPVIDTGLRNGIGHYSAHYDADSDQIIFYDTKGSARVTHSVGYTDFCDRLVRLFSAFELAVMYHNAFHIFLGGRLR